jgi:ribosomal protein S18 acetylase RimI-like enzyme
MIQLISVTNANELNDDLEQIYIDSFPSDERRDWLDLKKLINHPGFNFYKVLNDEKTIGLITVWNLPKCAFIEHFAIHDSLRSKGIGTQVFMKIMDEKPGKIVLEVEEATTEAAQRRITFYERMGFSVCDGIYYQPAYSPDKSKVKLLLMSHPELLLSKDFEVIKTQIYRFVYNFIE